MWVNITLFSIIGLSNCFEFHVYLCRATFASDICYQCLDLNGSKTL